MDTTALQSKKILITAGPTWVPIDRVRVITNIFGGTLGSRITEEALRFGADVTLLFGPGKAKIPEDNPNLNVIRYKYYDELLGLVKQEVGSKKYDVVIHSAAVADYVPIEVGEGKIKSGQSELVIRLKPTIKIVDLIKELDPDVFLVKFKLEVDVSDDKLIDIAYRSLQQSKADLIVANEFSTVFANHKAYIIDEDNNLIEVVGKENIAHQLVEEVIVRLNSKS